MMEPSLIAALVSIGALLLFSTLNLALRIPSRARMKARFERVGKVGLVPRFVTLRPQYMFATAVFRSVAMLTLFLAAMNYGSVIPMALDDLRTAVAAAVCLVTVLVFGVAIPNAWSKYCGEGLVVMLLPLLGLVRWLCYPFFVLLAWIDPMVRRLAGVPAREERSYADELEEEILNAVTEGELHGAVDEEEKEMIESVIEMADTRVDKIMTPRTQIVAVPIDADLPTVLETIRTRGHSRIPVFEGTIDHVLGILYVKDLLHRRSDAPFTLGEVMRKPQFIPETKSVRELLREFQERKVHIAIVLDEYGGTAGLVTIEDILEELVGDITDEYDATAPQELKRLDDSTVEVDARMRIADLNDQLNLELPEDMDYETLGGFVFSTLGKIPTVGEHFQADGMTIHVVAAEPRRITRLRLVFAAPAESSLVEVDQP